MVTHANGVHQLLNNRSAEESQLVTFPKESDIRSAGSKATGAEVVNIKTLFLRLPRRANNVKFVCYQINPE